MELQYLERTIAFIDILGFGALVREIGRDDALHRKLDAALKRIQMFKSASVAGNTAQSGLEISMFSDSVVISGPGSDIQNVLWTAIHVQCELMALGVLVRGGIACGRTIHAGDILYGEGMLAAYDLESKAAVYPRIVIHPSLIPRIERGCRAAFLDQDLDGLWFINPFTIGIRAGNSEALLADGYDPSEVSLKQLGRVIESSIATLTDAGQLAKWGWLKKQHELAIAEFVRYGKPRFWHLWAQAEKAKSGEGSPASK